jgi:GH25 family lysozyme M1 (1,4-beta-N-acetylmuramidase)
VKPIIDISFWQSPSLINYAVLAGQIAGVIIRACYGSSIDTQFDRHYSEFVSRGIPVGAYHYLIGNAGIQGQATAFKQACA